MKTVRSLLVAGAAAAALASCSSPNLPGDITCDRVVEGGSNGAALSKALAGASAGDCVVPSAEFYRGSFTVPAGVALVAEVGADVAFQGDQAGSPAIRLIGGEKSAVVGVRVRSAPSTGLLVQGSPALVADTTVENAAGTGLLVACLDGDDVCPKSKVVVRDTVVRASSIGLWAYRANLEVQGGRIADNKSQNLGGGYGVVASHGAALEMQGTMVQGNQEVGILVDDTTGRTVKTGTRARLTDLKVSDNLGRGIWGQGLDGTAEAPRLEVLGEATLVSNNRIVGIGVRESRGIIIINGRIEKTVAVEVPVGLGKLESVGDGVGAFEGAGAFKVDGVSFAANERCQVLVDHGARGIIIINGKFSNEGSRYGIVVQNTVEAVSASEDQLDQTEGPLAVSAAPMALASDKH